MRSLSRVIKSYEYDPAGARFITIVPDWTGDGDDSAEEAASPAPEPFPGGDLEPEEPAEEAEPGADGPEKPDKEKASGKAPEPEQPAAEAEPKSNGAEEAPEEKIPEKSSESEQPAAEAEPEAGGPEKTPGAKTPDKGPEPEQPAAEAAPETDGAEKASVENPPAGTPGPEQPAEEAAPPVQAEEVPAGGAGPEAAEPEAGPALRETEQRYQAVIREAFRKAKQIVDSAQNYRAEQLAEAERKIAAEAAEEKRRGYSEGYAEGREKGKKDGLAEGVRQGQDEGRKQAAAENRRTVAELGRMIEEVEKAKTQILQNFEGDLQELAVTMARSILKKELEIDQKAMRSIIVGAMDTYRNQEWVRIYVSDHTASVLLKADGGIVKALKEISDNVKVVSSKGMDDGACIIELPDQVIDAGIGTQLKRMKDAIETAETEPEPARSREG